MIDPVTAQQQLQRLTAQFAEVLTTADLRAPVPSCPGWDVDRLVRHLGTVHRWATSCLRPAGVGGGPAPAAGAERDTLVGWYRAAASALQEALRTTDPAAVVETFDERPGPAAFWSRRQVHEAAMHLWDLGTAAGRELGYDPDLAVDGIDEVVTVFFPRQVALGRTPPLTDALALAPDGHVHRWVLSGDGTSPASNATATLSGPPDLLLRAVWGRAGLDDPRLRVEGDATAAATVLAAGIVP